MKSRSPEQQLAGFIDKYTAEIAALARAALAKLRARLPSAIVMVYDNYNALAIGFGPSERPSEAIFSIALFPRWVSLFFLQGANLADPAKLLSGGGKVARHIVLEDAATLDKPAVRALMQQALEKAVKPIDGSGTGRMVIKPVAAKQRPRRPAERTKPLRSTRRPGARDSRSL
jgi:hypothetical protein